MKAEENLAMMVREVMDGRLKQKGQSVKGSISEIWEEETRAVKGRAVVLRIVGGNTA